jgi:hypothetical protein
LQASGHLHYIAGRQDGDGADGAQQAMTAEVSAKDRMQAGTGDAAAQNIAQRGLQAAGKSVLCCAAGLQQSAVVLWWCFAPFRPVETEARSRRPLQRLNAAVKQAAASGELQPCSMIMQQGCSFPRDYNQLDKDDQVLPAQQPAR